MREQQLYHVDDFEHPHDDAAGPTATVAAIAAKVPAAIKSKGTLVVGTDATYAPNEFLASDGHT